MKASPAAEERLRTFREERRAVEEARDRAPVTLSPGEIERRLHAIGFTKRKLTSEQLRDVAKIGMVPSY
jgi:hypothetical protein